jgi:hypothetical protein
MAACSGRLRRFGGLHSGIASGPGEPGKGAVGISLQIGVQLGRIGAVLHRLPEGELDRHPVGHGRFGRRRDRRRCRVRGLARFRRSIEPHSKGVHRLGNVLDAALAHILEDDDSLVPQMVAHASRHANPARLGHRLQAGGDIDAVAEDATVLDHHVADIDADAKDHAPLRGLVCVRGSNGLLDLRGAVDRIHHAGKFRQHAVARGSRDQSGVVLDQIVDDEAMVRQPRKGGRLVAFHMPAVGHDVGREDGDQFSLQTRRFHGRSFGSKTDRQCQRHAA